tara:strand:+ start:1171 stop:1608 length:438 start_codon:yes stop_codon:yes gene_type:complete
MLQGNMSHLEEMHSAFMIAYAKLVIGAHKHRVRAEQDPISRYFNHTAGRFVFARMMLLAYLNAQPHKYTITRVAETLDMSRQATSHMIHECLDAEYIFKCKDRGYFASEELFNAFLQFMPMHESIVKESGVIDFYLGLQATRKVS